MKRSLVIKIIVGVLVIGGGVGYFMVQAMQSSYSYYYTVDEFSQVQRDPADSYRLAGRVKDGSIERDVEAMTLRFILAGTNSEIPVVYQGIVPDNFEDGREVVAEGHLAEAGNFRADTLMTRCESKYQAKVN